MCFSFKSDFHADELKQSINAVTAKKSFEIFYQENPEGLSSTVFPNSYAVTLIQTKHGPTLLPMRYRIRPFGSKEEIPAKYNLYNARMESLLEKKTWRNLMGKKHAAIPMAGFNEWVSTENGKKIVQFKVKNLDLFWCAGLYDIWENIETKSKLITFAIITTKPTSDIEAVGHDRCPVILDPKSINNWIQGSQTPENALSLLPESMDPLEFSHEFTVV